MEQFADYGHAIASMALMGLFGLIMSPLVGMRTAKADGVPGGAPVVDYANPNYRWHRAYLNITETMGFFVAVTVAAILAGANPSWVNILASVFLVSRLVLFVVHVKGIGKPHTGARSFSYVAGWLCLVALGLMACWAVCS